jgi:membrane protein DedA with SNARE-associated domain
MEDALQILLQHGYWVVFGASLLEQMGAPVPAMPILLAVGAMSRSGHFSLTLAIPAAVAGSLAADLAWYTMGRYHGHFFLGLICRLSAAPGSCVQRSKDLFGRHGSPILLVSKFVPGFSATAIPLAGAERMGLMRFLLFDGVGAVLWAGGYMSVGYLFSSQLERVAGPASRFGMTLTVWIALVVTVIFAWKRVQRGALRRRNSEL